MASANGSDLLGQDPLGRTLADVLPCAFADEFSRKVISGDLPADSPWETTLVVAANGLRLDGASHLHVGVIIVEFEEPDDQEGEEALAAARSLQRAVCRLRVSGGDIETLARVAVSGIREISGYEHVLVYQTRAGTVRPSPRTWSATGISRTSASISQRPTSRDRPAIYTLEARYAGCRGETTSPYHSESCRTGVRGGRKLAIAADGSTLAPPRPRIDSTLVKALARAHRWSKLLENGRYGSAPELAAAEKINTSYVSRVLRLTLLAPDIVEAIVDGRQTDVVEADFIMKPFSATWAQQRAIFV